MYLPIELWEHVATFGSVLVWKKVLRIRYQHVAAVKITRAFRTTVWRRPETTSSVIVYSPIGNVFGHGVVTATSPLVTVHMHKGGIVYLHSSLKVPGAFRARVI